MESNGFATASKVVLEQLESGQLLVTPAALIRQRVPAIGREVIAEDAKALEILRVHKPKTA